MKKGLVFLSLLFLISCGNKGIKFNNGFNVYTQEPFWKLNISKEKIEFNNLGEITLFNNIKIDSSGSYISIRGKADRDSISIVIKEEKAYDTMSGEEYPFSAQIEWNKLKVNGTAQYRKEIILSQERVISTNLLFSFNWKEDTLNIILDKGNINKSLLTLDLKSYNGHSLLNKKFSAKEFFGIPDTDKISISESVLNAFNKIRGNIKSYYLQEIKGKLKERIKSKCTGIDEKKRVILINVKTKLYIIYQNNDGSCNLEIL